jgi:hypothetical protein
MQSILLVYGKFPINKIKRFLDADFKIVALDADSENILRDNGTKYIDTYHYELPDSNKNCIDWMNDWSCRKIDGQKNIKDVLLHDNFSYWWCMDQWLYYSFIYKDSYLKVIEYVDTIIAIAEKEHTSTIHYLDDGTLWSKTIRMVFNDKRYNKKPIAIKTKRPLLESIKENFRPLAIKIFLRAHILMRKLLWSIKNKGRDTTLGREKKYKILAAETHRWEVINHPKVHGSIEGDPHVFPITSQIRNAAITYIDIGERNLDFKMLSRKAAAPDDRILLEKYIGFNEILETRRIEKKFRSAITRLVKTQKFIRSWDYRGFNIWDLAAPQFLTYFRYRIEGQIRNYIGIRKMIQIERPDAFIFPGESGDLAYMFFKICRDSNIPCIGIQHGTLGYSAVIIHRKEEFEKDNPASMPTPNYLLIYGEYYKKLISDIGNFPADKIRIVGNVRFDFYAGKRLDKDVLMKKYGMKKGKPIMLFITQVLPFPSEEDIINNAVFKAAKELGFQLIIKQHPAEKSSAAYDKLVSDYDIPALILRAASTNELIFICDIMVGFESTLNYEGMIYGKPIININFGKRVNWLPFVKKGAAYPVTKPDQVIPAINKVLNDRKILSSLKSNMKKVLFEDCYKIDGLAATRIKDIVEGLLKDKR